MDEIDIKAEARTLLGQLALSEHYLEPIEACLETWPPEEVDVEKIEAMAQLMW